MIDCNISYKICRTNKSTVVAVVYCLIKKKKKTKNVKKKNIEVLGEKILFQKEIPTRCTQIWWKKLV